MTTSLQCSVCTGPAFVEYKLEDLTLCRCRDCGHCFTDLESLDCLEQYKPDYFEEEHRNWFLHPDLALYGKLSRIIREHSPSASILDVGCGNGNFLRYLQYSGNGLCLTGIDMARNEQVPGIRYLQGDFFDARFDGQFDAVVNLAVIEHVPDVIAFTKRLHDLCVPGGLVITMTVDERSIIYAVSRTLNRTGYSRPLKRLYSKHHLNHFTGSSLKRLLERNGLDTIQVIRHNAPMAAVDIPETSALSSVILRTGVWVGFQLGQLTQRTMLQTIVSRKTAS
jgi:2-polyprenyl-3-methyl-5-hydroxy-6-metoxy-1,4-benzoquinol methylase